MTSSHRLSLAAEASGSIAIIKPQYSVYSVRPYAMARAAYSAVCPGVYPETAILRRVAG
jgi:hypothetical protein